MSDSYRLLPGLHLVRRDADHLQLGLDPPHCVILKDTPEVRRLVGGLAGGRRPQRPGAEASRALAAILAAGLLVPDETASRRDRLRGARLRVDAASGIATDVTALLRAAGVVEHQRPGGADAVLLVTEGEPERGRLDALVRDEVPHLLVRDHGDALVLGPFVVPGATACLRCVDCHHGDADPRRALVVEQVATQPPLVPVAHDASLRAVALSLAVRDLVTFVEGGEPATWSSTIRVTAALDLVPRRWLRHPACGCAWDVLARVG